MRIAIGTNDRRTVNEGRFGDSVAFGIVDIANGEVVSTAFRENPHLDPGMQNKPPKILELLNDCDVFVGKGWRAGSFDLFAGRGKTVSVTPFPTIEETVQNILTHDGEFMIFDPGARKFVKGFVPSVFPGSQEPPS